MNNVGKENKENKLNDAKSTEDATMEKNKQATTGDAGEHGQAVTQNNSMSSRSKTNNAVIVDIFFKIILLASIGFVGFMSYKQDKAVDVLFDQQNSFNNQRNDTGEQISQLQSSLLALESNLEDQLTAASQETTTLIQLQSAEIEQLQNELINTRLRVTSPNSQVGQQWLLAEASALLRLAQQQLIVARRVRTAQALFIAADDVLKLIDDPAIFSVREILADELAAIRAVPEVDIQNIYLQLGAISNQTGTLQISNDLDQQIANGDPVILFNETQNENSGILSGFVASIKNLVNRFFVVRRRDEPIQTLMTPGQEAVLIQTVRLQIEQGRTALLKGEQEIYTSSLIQASSLINQYLSGEAEAKTSILPTLELLARRRIITELPVLSRTQAALEQILQTQESQPFESTNQQ